MGIVVLAGALLACCRGLHDDPVEVTTWDAAPSWSNAGDRLTFASLGDPQDSVPVMGLYAVDTTGENRVLLSPGGSHSTWLPGDTAIIFMKTNFKLYYLNLNTMAESLLCDCGFARFPEMSPDGRYLLISRHKVYRYDMVTDSEIVLFSPGLQARYDWSPDGSTIIIGDFLQT